MTPESDTFGTLRREHEFVEDLLGRLVELGERIHDGERVSPGTVRLGVGLLDAYLHRVHAHQFDRDLWPAAKAVAGRECSVPLETVRANHARLRRSSQEILGLISRWMAGDLEAPRRVARRLIELAAADEAENVFEEQHPFACLETNLSRATQLRVGTLFTGHVRTKVALETNIARYLNFTRPGDGGAGTSIPTTA
jgi:hypothetical protein